MLSQIFPATRLAPTEADAAVMSVGRGIGSLVSDHGISGIGALRSHVGSFAIEHCYPAPELVIRGCICVASRHGSKRRRD